MIVRILKFCSSSSCFRCLFSHVQRQDFHSLNYYEVLGIDTSVYDEDSVNAAMIDNAFNQKLVELNLHVLQFEEYTVEERKTYMLLSKAYHVLTNPKRRALYNSLGYVGLNLIEHPSSLNLFTLFQSIQLTQDNGGTNITRGRNYSTGNRDEEENDDNAKNEDEASAAPPSSSMPILGRVLFTILLIGLVFYCILIGNKLDGIGYGSRLRWVVLLIPLWIFDALLLLTTLIFLLEEREDSTAVNEENESNLHVSYNSSNHHSIPSNVQQISHEELSGNRVLMATSSMLNTTYDDTEDGFGARGTALLNTVRSICFVWAQYAFVMKIDNFNGQWDGVSWTLVLLPWILYEVSILAPKLIAYTCEENAIHLSAAGVVGLGGMRPDSSKQGFRAYRGIDYDTGSLLFNVDAYQTSSQKYTPSVANIHIGAYKSGKHSYTPLGGDNENIHDVEQSRSMRMIYDNIGKRRREPRESNNRTNADSSKNPVASSVFNSEAYSNSSNDSIYDDPVVDKNVYMYRQINEANHFFQMMMRVVTDRRQTIVSALRLCFVLLLLLKMTKCTSLSWYVVMSPCWIYTVYELFFLNNMRRWGRSFFKGVNVRLIIASMRTFKIGDLNHFKVQRGAEVLAWVLSGLIVHITFIVFALCFTISLDEDEDSQKSASRMSMCNVLLLIACAYGIGIAAIYYAVMNQSLPSIDTEKRNTKVTVSTADMYYTNASQQVSGNQGFEMDTSPLFHDRSEGNINNGGHTNRDDVQINGSEEMKLTSSGEETDYGSIA